MKAMKMTTKWICVLVLALSMMLASPFAATASEQAAAEPNDGGNTAVATETAEDPRDSIMMMTIGYEDDQGKYVPFFGGSSFLINDEYVLTNYHVVTLDDTELDQMRKTLHISNLQRNDSHIKLYLYVNRDMKVAATMHKSVNSAEMDFAAVKLSEKIYDRKPLALGDSSKVQTTDPVEALGFPEDSFSTKNYNTKEDVSIVDGTISKLTVTGNVDIFEHTALLNHGNSGGPLVNANNAVIGVNSFMLDKKNYAIQINYIKDGLNTFGIPYVDETNSAPAPEPADTDTEKQENVEEPEEKEDNSALISALQSAISDAKALDTANYSEESVKNLNDAIGAAEAVAGNSEAEATEIQDATDALNKAVNGLEEKSGPNMVLIIIIAAVAAAVIIVVVILVVNSKKKRKTSAGPIPTAGGYNSQPQNNIPPAAPTAAPVQKDIPEGAGETTLLDAGAGETTLLSGAGGAYLIRKKNGEKITINLPNFKIGKERKRVNYCIADNTSVSRVHCEIVKKGSDYYVVDQGATNYTYVNGIQISPRQETLLSDQSVLKLSDEEFEFHLS